MLEPALREMKAGAPPLERASWQGNGRLGTAARPIPSHHWCDESNATSDGRALLTPSSCPRRPATRPCQERRDDHLTFYQQLRGRDDGDVAR